MGRAKAAPGLLWEAPGDPEFRDHFADGGRRRALGQAFAGDRERLVDERLRGYVLEVAEDAQPEPDTVLLAGTNETAF